jgi:hypothetical protein
MNNKRRNLQSQREADHPLQDGTSVSSLFTRAPGDPSGFPLDPGGLRSSTRLSIWSMRLSIWSTRGSISN